MPTISASAPARCQETGTDGEADGVAAIRTEVERLSGLAAGAELDRASAKKAHAYLLQRLARTERMNTRLGFILVAQACAFLFAYVFRA